MGEKIRDIFRENFFENASSEYVFIETEEGGKGELTLHCKNDKNLCVLKFDKKNVCNCLKIENRVDLVIFELNENKKWDIHLIEMKKSVGNKKWKEEIKDKFIGSYLAAKAIAALLIYEIGAFYFYTAYANDRFINNEETVNTAGLKSYSDGIAIIPKNEWNDNHVYLKIYGRSEKFKHTRIKMEEKDGILYRKFSL